MKKQKKSMLNQYNRTSAFDVVLLIVLGLMALVTLYPFYYVLIVSVSNTVTYATHPLYLLPYTFDWTGYQTIFNDPAFYRSLGVTLFVTFVGTALNMLLSVTGVPVNMVLTILVAYPLSKTKHQFHARQFYVWFFFITMLFSGGVIPSYLVTKDLGLVNNIWVMVLPTAINTYYLIIMKNYFASLPSSLLEAAKLDGANELTVLIRIIVPISMPFMATFFLFYAVERWNEWYQSFLYINKTELQPLQIYLRNVLISMSNNLSAIAKQMMRDHTQKVSSQAIQMATIVVTTIPILCVYPFVQKHFVKGVMIGGIKE